MTAQHNGSTATKGNGRRKRGGQPGNTSAVKHGFYTKNFSPAERRELESVGGIVLGDEIALLRVLIRRFADQILSSRGVSLNESAQAERLHSKSALAQRAVFDRAGRFSAVPHTWVCGQHLDVISEAMLRLGSLMRTNHMLGGKLSGLEPHQRSTAHMGVRSASDTLFEELNLAIAQVSAEMALEGREGSAEV
jgi:hypothetical protein